MPQSINRHQILGYLGADPELKATETGIAVCNFNVATTKNYKDQNGEWQSKTEWHNCQAWEFKAEEVANNYKKGQKIFLEGEVKTNNYEKDGIKRSYTYTQISNIFALKKKEPKNGNSNNVYGTEPPPKSMQGQWDEQHKSKQQLEDDDDVPF